MILIIGGAYQGKLAYATSAYQLSEKDIYTCDGGEIDFSKRCIYAIEKFVYHCVQNGKDPIACFCRNRQQWENSILICQDLFCGVVPLGADMRIWRQETGKLCQYLSKEAQQVFRILCGLEQHLK